VSEGSLKDHLINLVNALTNLSPSRNIISQLLLLTPEEQTTLSHSFPELEISEFREILRAMGVLLGDKVKCAEGSFAEALTRLIHKTFDWLDDEYLYFELTIYGSVIMEIMKKMEDVRSSLAKLTGLHIDLIPNPYLEWAKLVIEKLSRDYGRDKVMRFMKSLLSKLPLRERDRPRSIIDEVGAEVGASPAELKEICELLAFSERGAENIYTKGSSRHPTGYVSIVHCKYHLDPLLLEESRSEGYHYYVTYVYTARHGESLRRALEEVM
jgi:hypothetical protein